MNLKKMICMGVASCTLLTSQTETVKEVDNAKRVEQLEKVVQQMLKEIQDLKDQGAQSQKQEVVIEQADSGDQNQKKIILTVKK